MPAFDTSDPAVPIEPMDADAIQPESEMQESLDWINDLYQTFCAGANDDNEGDGEGMRFLADDEAIATMTSEAAGSDMSTPAMNDLKRYAELIAQGKTPDEIAAILAAENG